MDTVTPELIENDTRLAVEREYLRRRDARQETLQRHVTRDLAISRCRTATALVTLFAAWAAFGPHFISGWWITAPVFAFVSLMVVHERILQAKQRAEQAVAFYDAGLRRIEDRWIGRGVTRNDFASTDHPYAADLDLFGRGSLFDLLCRAGTRAGQNCLAAWLLSGADTATVVERQKAVADLRSRLDFREDLALLGEATIIDTALLGTWGESPALLTESWLRPAAWALAAAGVATVVAWWPLRLGPIPLLVVLAIGQLFLRRIGKPLAKALSGVEKTASQLEALSALLARIESESCDAPLLRRLRTDLMSGGIMPSVQIKRLQRLLDWLNLQGSLFFAPIARILLWSVHCAFAIEAWRQVNGPKLRVWVRVIAEFEALSSLASHAYEHPADVVPEIVDAGTLFEAEGLGHPLLPERTVVRNDIALSDDVRLFIVSGSNMSGKSTLLRTIGTNTVLALAGASVRATQLRLSPLQIGASLRTQDSLQGGVSRFYAEIVRLRQIVAMAEHHQPLLFLLDEILHGTNSHDRLAGAEAIARSLVRQDAVGLITTHDLALARIEADPELHAVNVHFEDQLADGKMSFDYHLRPGVVARSNALELMRAVGLDV